MAGKTPNFNEAIDPLLEAAKQGEVDMYSADLGGSYEDTGCIVYLAQPSGGQSGETRLEWLTRMVNDGSISAVEKVRFELELEREKSGFWDKG